VWCGLKEGGKGNQQGGVKPTAKGQYQHQKSGIYPKDRKLGKVSQRELLQGGERGHPLIGQNTQLEKRRDRNIRF